MQSALKRGVPLGERPKALPAGDVPDWDNVRFFLQVVRSGSFRAASDTIGVSINVLRRRVTELEQQLGCKLLTRHVDGVRVTSEGVGVLDAAQNMETASFELLRSKERGAQPQLAGEIRIAVTEGIGTFWLAPRLVEFQQAYPKLLIDLFCAMQSADVLRMEADVAIQLTKPTAPDVKMVRLGRLHAMLFAGPSYIETYGCPRTYEELLNHRIVMLFGEQSSAEKVYNQLFPNRPQPGFLAFRTNVSSAHYWAMAKGAGIGWLPTYAPAVGANVVPIDIGPGLIFPFDIWLTYHAESREIPRVRRLIDWIIESFDPRRFPWFRDEFIHPRDLPGAYKGAPLVNMFAGFSGEEHSMAVADRNR